LAWDSLGEYQKAIGLYEQALAIFNKTLGQDHPYTQTVAGNLQRTREMAKE
jgi:tetratricopeptide (TPR) repeat protein